MLERALDLFNLCVGGCTLISFVLWVMCLLVIFYSKHPRSSMEQSIASAVTVTGVLGSVFFCGGGWLYIAGVLS